MISHHVVYMMCMIAYDMYEVNYVLFVVDAGVLAHEGVSCVDVKGNERPAD